jgi:SAM-dependent methyltransferase
MEHIGCPLCDGAPRSRPYHEERGYAAVQCERCGLVYVTPRPTEAEMKRLYEGQDTHVDVAAQIQKRHRKLAEARSMLRCIQRFARAGRLLEIGPGAGYLLDTARAAGFDGVGLDINRHFASFARGALGLQVIEGTLRTARFEPATFDVVVHRNVLSHLAYPVDELARMRDLLRPGGVMVFETGNVAELPSAIFRGTEALALPDHLFHFSEATLRRLLERTGFACLDVERRAELGSLAPLLAARRGLASLRGAAPPPAPKGTPPDLPASAPPVGPLRLALARAERAVTERAGAWLAAEGRRCTLVVAARKEHAAPSPSS